MNIFKKVFGKVCFDRRKVMEEIKAKLTPAKQLMDLDFDIMKVLVEGMEWYNPMTKKVEWIYPTFAWGQQICYSRNESDAYFRAAMDAGVIPKRPIVRMTFEQERRNQYKYECFVKNLTEEEYRTIMTHSYDWLKKNFRKER